MPGLYGNVGNTTVSGGNTTGLYSTTSPVTVSNNINVNDINASGNLFVAGTGTFGGNVTAPNFNGNLVGGNISGVNLDLTGNAEIDGNLTVGGTIFGTFSGNIAGNIVVPGANTNVLFNNNGNAGSSNDFTFNDATNVMTVNGTANVGVLNATGNITGDYFFGNAAFMTGIPATYGNANVESLLASGTITSNVITAGNISGNYILGNGSQLTGLPATYSNANVTSLMANFGSNVIVTTGNITGGNFIGNGQYLTNLPGANVTGTVANATYATNAGAATSATSATTAVTVTGNAQANITSVGTLTSLAVSGNVTTGNVSGTNGTFTTVIGNGAQLSNITGANVTGTVANATYATSAGSATTATHATTANTVTDAAQGNITSLGTLTGLTVGGDQNITGNLIVGQNLTVNGNTIQVNITELNVQDPIIGLGRGENNAPLTSNDGKDRGEQLWYYAGSEKSAFTGYDNSAGNLILATDVAIANEIVSVNAWGTTEVGDLYAHGNITGDYVFGNAAFMTGIPAQYGNANVADFLDSFGSNAIVTTGNVTAGYFFGDGSGLTNINAGNIVGSYGNANVANFLANYGSNTIVTTGNISGGNVIGTFLYGDGTNITGVVAGAASTRIEVKNTSGVTITKGTPVYATGTVGASTIIEIAASRADTASTMPCLGLLAQDLNNNDQGYAISVGTLTSTNTNGFTTGQELYVAAAGGLTASRPTGTNIVQTVGIVGRVNSVNGSIEVNIWNVNSLPNLGNGNVWIGNANGFPTQQVAYGDANVAAYLPTYTGNLAGGNITVTGVYYGNGSGLTSITGANVTGTVANATYATSAGSAGTATTAVTVTGNAQANITSVGTLTTLTVSGNIGTGGILTDNYYYANGTPISFGGTYGNANVADYLPTYTGNIRAVTGSIAVANTVANLAIGPSAANLVVQGNLHVAGGFIRSTATDGVIFGATTGTGNLYTTAATVNIGGTGGTTNLRGAAAVTGNVTGANLNTAGRVVATGTVIAGAVTYANTDGTNGQVLTTYGNGITYWSNTGTSAYGNSNVASYLASGTLTSNIITSGGLFVTNSDVEFSKELRVAGNIYANASNIQCQVLKLDNNGDIIGTSGANINLSGTARFTGNVTTTGGVFIGDGSGLTNIPYGNVTGAYGNANVSNFLANGFGSNTITTTGNITVGNLNATQSVVVSGVAGNITGANYVNANFFVGNGSLLTGITSSSSNSFSTIAANGTNIVAVTSTDTLTLTPGSGISITGNATTDTITISATGGGGGTPGGSDTQIQFNDSSAFAGNAQMTFSKTTGNVAFGNLVIKSTSPNSAAVITNVNALNPTARPLLGRVVLGAGFDGDWGNTGDYLATTRNSAVTSMNRFVQTSVSNTNPMIGTSVATWFDNNAGNVITSAGNARGIEIDTYYTGANRWGTQGTTGLGPYNGLRVMALGGNGVSGGSIGTIVGASITAGTTSNNATLGDTIGIVSNQFAGVSGANHGNVYGLTFNMNSTNPTVGNTYLIHNQSSSSGTHSSQWGIGGNFRSANRYFMLRNDDDVAQVKLGSLRTYHELLGNATQSTSSITIGPRQGPVSQVVRTTPTEAITSVTFTGFITSASDGTNTDFQTDTMTWIIQQGATPYAITMPTGNAQIKYAGGVSTIGTTANAVTMCAITAYDNAGTTNYLVTISPEFT